MGEDMQRRSAHRALKKLLELAIKDRHPPLFPWTNYELNEMKERAISILERARGFHEALVAACTTTEAADTQDEEWDKIEETFQELKRKIGKIKGHLNSQTPSMGSNNHSNSSVNVKLPALTLPTFNGKIENWASFKDLFTATIDSNNDLSKAQKLQYLKSSLQNDASMYISSLTVTDENYDEAWKLLDERFDNKREAVHQLIKKIISVNGISHESATELRTLVDTVVTSLSALNAIKVNNNSINLQDALLFGIIFEKLDSSTKKEWSRTQNDTDLPSYQKLIEFLNKHIRTLGEGKEKPINGIKKPTLAQTPNKNVKVHHAASTKGCLFCSEEHSPFKCQVFMSKNPHERRQIVKEKHLCFNCLSAEHSVKDCTSQRTCKQCQGKHHTLLHENREPRVSNLHQNPQTEFSSQSHANPSQPRRSMETEFKIQPQQIPQTEFNSPQPGPSRLNSYHASAKSQVLLATANVWVQDKSGGYQLCRAFLDTGSEGTFVTERCVQRLQLSRNHSRLNVTGVSAASIGTTKGKVNLHMMGVYEPFQFIDVEAHILPKVTNVLPKFKCNARAWPHINGIPLADREYHEPSEVDILIGAEYHHQIYLNGIRKGPPDAPVAQYTIFGWILCGRVPIESHLALTSYHTDMVLNQHLEQFWTIEEGPCKKILTKEEKECIRHFGENTTIEDGTYKMKIPFKKKNTQWGFSRDQAVQRFQNEEKGLANKFHLRTRYEDSTNKYENSGHMELIPKEECYEVKGRTYYLPHHFVLNDTSTTTKLRVVFDGSAKSTTGVLLNDTMPAGPSKFHFPQETEKGKNDMLVENLLTGAPTEEKAKFHFRSLTENVEEKSIDVQTHHDSVTEEVLPILQSFSSLVKLKRTTALILRWKAAKFKSIDTKKIPFTVFELEAPLKYWIKVE